MFFKALVSIRPTVQFNLKLLTVRLYTQIMMNQGLNLTLDIYFVFCQLPVRVFKVVGIAINVNLK